jgi:hypothetical protein
LVELGQTEVFGVIEHGGNAFTVTFLVSVVLVSLQVLLPLLFGIVIGKVTVTWYDPLCEGNALVIVIVEDVGVGFVIETFPPLLTFPPFVH